MNKDVNTIEEYLAGMPEERLLVINRLREVFQNHLPDGFEETIQYNMITYVVPLSTYPSGYLGKKDTPLPFISVASQKHHVAIYHMGIYMNKEVLEWFETEYDKRNIGKLDMGKSCIRFNKMDQIPYDLISELAQKITVEEFIAQYEQVRT